jgi:antiviral helicase SKI2
VPFWPGGLEDASSRIPEELEDEIVGEGKGIRTIPPGFTRGLRLSGEEDETGLDELDRILGQSTMEQGDVVSSHGSYRAG